MAGVVDVARESVRSNLEGVSSLAGVCIGVLRNRAGVPREGEWGV
jgi:hypothetical protein